MKNEINLAVDLPSLRLGYEQIKNVLHQQAEIARDYVNRAITLFAVATAVIGIGLPLLLTERTTNHVPAISLSVIPILFYAAVIVYFWKVVRPEYLRTVSSPKIVIEEYIDLNPDGFYSETIQDIDSTFNENQKVIKRKENAFITLIVLVIGETVSAVSLVLLFFAFGWFC